MSFALFVTQTAWGEDKEKRAPKSQVCGRPYCTGKQDLQQSDPFSDEIFCVESRSFDFHLPPVRPLELGALFDKWNMLQHARFFTTKYLLKATASP